MGDQDQLICKSCGNGVSEHHRLCANCGYPLKGNIEEQEKFILEKSKAQWEIRELFRKIQEAQIILYVLSGLFFLTGILYYFIYKDLEAIFISLIINLVLSAGFLALGGWSKTKPFTCIVIGLMLYFFTILIPAINDAGQLFKGLLLKGVIIGLLIKGLISAREAERLRLKHKIK